MKKRRITIGYCDDCAYWDRHSFKKESGICRVSQCPVPGVAVLLDEDETIVTSKDYGCVQFEPKDEK